MTRLVNSWISVYVSCDDDVCVCVMVVCLFALLLICGVLTVLACFLAMFLGAGG